MQSTCLHSFFFFFFPREIVVGFLSFFLSFILFVCLFVQRTPLKVLANFVALISDFIELLSHRALTSDHVVARERLERAVKILFKRTGNNVCVKK